MALQFIIGGSGSGKSHQMYEALIKASIARPGENFIVIVPEQYTMQTQKNIVTMHPRHGVMNIDIVSFERLAYRIFEELSVKRTKILEDTGKRMVIRKILARESSRLKVFGGSVRKSGFSGELKSMISELLQYNITPDGLADCLNALDAHSVLYGKLKDLELLYRSFKDYIEGHYLTAEELLSCLCPYLADSRIIRESWIYLDNFTGFTPAQYQVLSELLKYGKGVQIALTVDVRSLPYELKNNYELFYLTKDTIRRLERLCGEIHCERTGDMLLDGHDGGRFKEQGDLFHLEQNIFRRNPAVYEKTPEQLFLYSAKNPGEETQFIARRIRSLVRDQGYRYRDIAVICGDLDGYRHMVERSFDVLDIPVFIDTKRSILNNAFVESLRALLEMFADRFSYESVFRFLRSGFADIDRDDIDLLENYVLAFGIRGAAAWQGTWMKRQKTLEDAQLLLLNQLREQAFASIWPLYEIFKDKTSTVAMRTDSLLSWISQEKISEKLAAMAAGFEREGRLSMAREYTQVYDLVIDLLEKYRDILGDEIVGIKEYSEILDAGLDEEKLGLIPPGIDEVTVGDIKRTRLDGIRVLFFMGMNEGIVPSVPRDGGLINDREKERLSGLDVELAPTARAQGYFEQFYIYTAFSKASDQLWLSYSQVSAGGKAIRPSSLIRRVCRLFPELVLRECEREDDWRIWLSGREDAFLRLACGFGTMEQEQPRDEWKELYGWFLQQPAYKKAVNRLMDAAFISYISRPLSRAAVQAVYGCELSGSVTMLEQYGACAYAHFLQYGLCLGPREESRIQAPDIGIILHQALERFASAIAGLGYTWKDVPEDVREDVSKRCAEEAAKDFNHTVLLETKRSQYQIKRLVRYVLRTTWAVKQQLSRGEFLPEAFELRFDSDALEGFRDIPIGADAMMRLKGTIDRLDVCETGDQLYVKIVDYKSGNKHFDLAALYYGLSLQLVVYLNMARAMEEKAHPQKTVIPAGILYYNIDDPLIEHKDALEDESAPPVEDEILVKLKSSGLVNGSPEVIRLLDRDFTKDSQVIPVSLTASGALSKRSSVASKQQFDELGRFVSHKVRRFGKEIFNGSIDVNPYIRGTQKACTYCMFRSICTFDERIPGFDYRRLGTLGAGEAWEAIHRWNTEHGQEKKEEADNHGGTVDR